MLAVKTLLRSASTLSPAQVRRRREPRRLAFLSALVVAFIAVLMIDFDVLTKASDELRAFAVIDGVEQPTRVGAVLAQGQLVGTGEEQYCDMPETTYGLSGSSNGVGSISLQVTSDCQLVVSSIDASASKPEGFASESHSMRDIATDPSQPGYVRSFETRGPDVAATGLDLMHAYPPGQPAGEFTFVTSGPDLD